MMRVTFNHGGKTWHRTMPRIDAGTLAEACAGIPVASFECESDYRRGEMLGTDGSAIGSWRAVEVPA